MPNKTKKDKEPPKTVKSSPKKSSSGKDGAVEASEEDKA